ncbi:MAG: hypothetical protein KIT27_05605 [Legionellales bacterium]|nr:hypothetical protein [Legionellales bacterium]
MNDMNKLLQEAAKRDGFNLEFLAKEKLNNSGYTVFANKIFIENDSLIETDLIAIDNTSSKNLIIECKGRESDSLLLVVTRSKHDLSEEEKEALDHVSRISLIDHFHNGYRFHIPRFDIQEDSAKVFTGDFFRADKNNGTIKGYTKISKNEDQNNYYKAKLQLAQSVKSFISETEELPGNRYIYPIIVVNSAIWTVDYNRNADDPIIYQHKWVLQQFDTALPLIHKEDLKWNQEFFSIVVSIEYFDDLLNKINQHHPTTPLDRNELTLQSGLI